MPPRLLHQNQLNISWLADGWPTTYSFTQFAVDICTQFLHRNIVASASIRTTSPPAAPSVLHDTTPVIQATTPVVHDNTPVVHDNTPVVRATTPFAARSPTTHFLDLPVAQLIPSAPSISSWTDVNGTISFLKTSKHSLKVIMSLEHERTIYCPECTAAFDGEEALDHHFLATHVPNSTLKAKHTSATNVLKNPKNTILNKKAKMSEKAKSPPTGIVRSVHKVNLTVWPLYATNHCLTLFN